MVRIIFTLVIYIVSQFLGAQNIEQVQNKKELKTNQLEKIDSLSIKVTVPNITNDKGELIVVLYNSAEAFYNKTPHRTLKSKINNRTASVIFENLTPGQYAIVCLHDENLNERMDFETNGMPKEDYGMSNNVLVMGPPNFEDAKFKLENKSLDLNIRF